MVDESDDDCILYDEKEPPPVFTVNRSIIPVKRYTNRVQHTILDNGHGLSVDCELWRHFQEAAIIALHGIS